MPKKPMDATVKAQLASLTLKLDQVTKQRDQFQLENKALRKQNTELASVIETDLKTDAKMRILSASDFKEVELNDLSIEQLQQIEETLAKSKGAAEALFKPIRAAHASTDRSSMLTVGNLYGKSQKEIRDMGGEF